MAQVYSELFHNTVSRDLSMGVIPVYLKEVQKSTREPRETENL